MVTHDVEEALYLSQRIYVFSSRPGRVKKEMAVPFGEERTRQVRRDPRFLDLREEVQTLLIAEVEPV
jgi:ABC-type nitrate/sulfonate/bicarbonate transport system ATPase subunit